jgi:hypothetical protein
VVQTRVLQHPCDLVTLSLSTLGVVDLASDRAM